MNIPKYVFWACLLLVAHTYLLYPIFLVIASTLVQMKRDWRYPRSRQDRRARAAPDPLPSVTLIVPAHNEEARLPGKLANTRALDYPADRLEVIFVSDGSTDGTESILRATLDPNIRCILLPTRGGKSNALNHAVAQAGGDILIFSDAATLFAPDAVKKLARHFATPRVGVVCGALEFEASAESRQTEGVYWTYECMLRLMEARLGATLTASGAIYAVRRECYPTLPPTTLLDDFVIPMNARKLGYRVIYDPEAVGTDFAASTVTGEFTRRVRVATGSFRALPRLARTPLDPMTAFAFFSHKILRWTLPFHLIGLVVSSALLCDHAFYRAALVLQVLFYAWAGLGFLFRQRLRNVRYALIAYYLSAIHVAFLVGFMRFLFVRVDHTWQRVN